MTMADTPLPDDDDALARMSETDPDPREGKEKAKGAPEPRQASTRKGG
jgi:hypothetical protein